MKLNVETAYWNLYAAYGQLFAREIALRKNLEVWRLTKERVEAGVKQFTKADEYEAQGQYESSRSDWLAALGNVLDRERILRSLIGLSPEDERRLVPIDTPTLAAFRPDWATAYQEALLLKPELVIEREQLKAQQLNIIDWKNRALPDLTTFGAGTSTRSAIAWTARTAAPTATHCAIWRRIASTTGRWVCATMCRSASATPIPVCATRLRLAQMYWKLRTDEDRVEHNLELWYRNVIEYQEQIQRNMAAMRAYNEDLNVRIQRVRGGQETPDVTLQAIRLGSAAMVQYYQYLGEYNSALAHFEYSKGTLLRANNIVIADGPMPDCPAVKLIEHNEERANSLDLRDRSAAIPCAGPGSFAAPWLAPAPDAAFVPDVVSVPDYLKSRPALPPEVNEAPPPLPITAPAPRTLDQLNGATTLPTLPPAPTRSSPTSYGVQQPLTFPGNNGSR